MRHLAARLAAAHFLISATVVGAAPQDAVVRIKSHGCSGTVIETRPGRTLILTCAHAWERPQDRHHPIRIDAPAPRPGSPRGGTSPRVIRIDYGRNDGSGYDLALIEMQVGPLPYVCPVAPTATSSTRCTSAGYDNMRWPMTVRSANVVAQRPTITYTREIPWHGRSGGALIDERGLLVGVVSGYEPDGERRGMYASHAAVLAFLGRSRSPAPTYPAPRTPFGDQSLR